MQKSGRLCGVCAKSVVLCAKKGVLCAKKKGVCVFERVCVCSKGCVWLKVVCVVKIQVFSG